MTGITILTIIGITLAAIAVLSGPIINHKAEIVEWLTAKSSEIKDTITERENYMVLIPLLLALAISISLEVFNINLTIVYVLLGIAIILAIAGIGHMVYYNIKSRKENN